MKYNLANVHPNAKIAETATIEPFATVHEDVVIGEGAKICANAVIMDGARIGKNVTVFPGAVISAIPQDLKYEGEKTVVEIGDNTIIREYVTINKGTNAAGKTVVGKNCLLMAYVHVAHDCIVGNNVILVNNVQLAGEVEVGDFAILGGSTLVHQFCHIGAHVMTQGGLLLGKDIPPYTKAARQPAAFTGLNSIGLRRRGFKPEQINNVQEIYRIVFSSGLNYTNALNKVKEEIEDSAEKTEVVTFMENSKRGLIPNYSGK